MPQYCYRCNTENPDTARHCSNCGQELRAAPIGVRSLIVGAVLMLAGFLGGTITAVMEAHSWRGNAEYAWLSLSLFIWFLVVPGLIVWIVSLAKALRQWR